MTTARTDIHSPAEMVPSNYQYLASSYGIPTEIVGADGEDHIVMDIEWDGTQEWENLGAPTASTVAHARDGQCDHCGAHHKYQTMLLCVPTGEILSVGHDCATNRFAHPEWTRNIADGARRAELKHWRTVKIEKGLAAMDDATRAAYVWATSQPRPENMWSGNNRVIVIAQDIASKVASYGPLSEKQAAFLVKLHADAVTPKAPEEPLSDCLSGRIVIRGKVLCVKKGESDFGPTLKMLVMG